MKTSCIPNTDLEMSCIGFGPSCPINWDRNPVRVSELSAMARVVNEACEQGITLFDHADIYAFGKCEEAFGQLLRQSVGLRDRIVIQSKCGQVFSDGWQPGKPIHVDLSYAHIVSAVEGSLRRLGSDHLDILLLHAPDALMKTEEVAQAFDRLHDRGKVRYFGVSNFNAAQIALLKKSVRQPIVVNQIKVSLSHPQPLADGLDFTVQIAKGSSEDDSRWTAAGLGTVDYCRQNNIQIQAWSPLRGVLQPSARKASDGPIELQTVAQLLAEGARQNATTPAALALAWLLRHPAGIVPIIGGSNPAHVAANAAADRIQMTREEWYDLFVAAVSESRSNQ